MAAASAAVDDLELVSRASGADGTKGDKTSIGWTLSGDGRFAAFYSNATNLDPADADANTGADVYVRDLQNDTLVLASRADGADGAKANGISFHPAISAGGRHVAFTTTASNLDPVDTGVGADVYVRDLETGEVVLASRASGPDGAHANSAGVSSISADGRFVAFLSSATNLHPDDADQGTDIFLRDLQENTLTLVSRAEGAGGANGNGHAYAPVVSGDGRFVAFESSATNLHPDDTDAQFDVFVRDIQTGELTLVTRAEGAEGAAADGHSFAPAISADGRFVAFESSAANLHADDTDAGSDVFVRDLTTHSVVLASRATGAGGAKGASTSDHPEISGDGRFVTFSSRASNLDPADTDTTADVFVRDVRLDSLVLVSRAAGPDGATGAGDDAFPAISANGRFVTFSSFSTNLHPGDTDGIMDVLVREMAIVEPPAPPTATPTPTPTSTPTPAPSPAPTPPPAPGECGNGADDDRDGWIDAADPQCRLGRSQEAPADNPVLTCAGAGLVLTDVLPAGRRVRIAGFANPALAGREVLVYAGARRVGRTRLKADGSYATTVARRGQRYQTRIGDLRSRALKLNRKAVDASIAQRGGTVTLKGRVIARRRRGARVELQVGRPGACNAYTAVARKRLPGSGRFSISAPAPADRAVAVYRARIRLPGQTTYTLPRVLFVR